MQTETFYDLLQECRTARINQEYEKTHPIMLTDIAKREFILFKCWCRAFKNAEFTEQNFKEYIEKENKQFNFWLKKRIAELFFGYEFTFHHDTMSWTSVKKTDC